jgi:protein gp37
MADVFEARGDLTAARERLWRLIDSTPSLDWLPLTKRPEHAAGLVPWEGKSWPPNVWLGATVESQEWATMRIPLLLSLPARVHFLSCEPLLGALDLREWLPSGPHSRIDWVIAGGESGPRARPLAAEWLRALRDQCLSAGVPFHFKQWGEWGPAGDATTAVDLVKLGKKAAGRHLDGRTWDEVPLSATA